MSERILFYNLRVGFERFPSSPLRQACFGSSSTASLHSSWIWTWKTGTYSLFLFRVRIIPIPTAFPVWTTSKNSFDLDPRSQKAFQGTLDFFIELTVLTLHFWAPLSCLVITSGTWMQCFLRTSLHFTYKVQRRTLFSQGSPLLAARWFSWGKSSPPVVVTPLCQWCHCIDGIHVWVLSSHYPDLN